MKKPNNYMYPAIFTYEDGYEIAVTFPDLPGCATSGADEAESLAMASDALGGYLWCLEQDGDIIPQATKLKDVEVLQNQRAILVDVYMPAIRESQNNKSVNQTITLPAWLNAQALSKGVNFSSTLQNALMDQLHINR